MDNNPNTPQKVYKSSEIIQAVLDALGLQRTNSSEYVTYTADGKVLRVRVSDHGVNLSAWYRNNEGEVIPLSNSDNIAFTFLPNRDECKTLNIKFPPKVINKTPVYSDLKTKTPIDYEFTVMHYVYSSWKFTEEYLNLLTNAIVNYTTSGKFIDPLANTSAKAVLFNDTSNKKPQKIKQNTSEIKTENKQYNKNRNMKQTIKLRESELKRMIAESVKGAINELDWKTYDSAMRKAAEKGQWERVGAFGDASKRAFNKQFGYEGHPEDYAYGRHLTPYQRDFDSDLEPIDNTTISNQGYYGDSVYLMHPNDRGHIIDREDMYYRRTPRGKIEKDSPIRKNKNDYNDLDWYLNNGYEDGADINSAMDAAKKGEEDTLNYLKGKTKYIKGKGWGKNESINRIINRIVSESIRRNIR